MEKVLQAGPTAFQMVITNDHPSLKYGSLLFYPRSSNGNEILNHSIKMRLEHDQIIDLINILEDYLADTYDRRSGEDRRKS